MRNLLVSIALAACAAAPARRATTRRPATVEHVPAAACAPHLGAPDSHAFVGPTKPTARWVYAVPRGWVYGLALDASGVLLSSEAGVFALDERGSQRWHRGAVVAPRTTAAIGADGGAYAHVIDDRDGTLHDADFNHGAVLRVDACGATTWRFHAAPQNGKTPAIGADGTVYFAGNDRAAEREQVFAVHADGTTAWTHEVARGNSVTTPVLPSRDGGVAYGTYKGDVVALDATGKERWTTTVVPGQVVWNAARGPDGTVYAFYSDMLVALDTTGHVLWQQEVGKSVFPAPAFGDDGTVYVGGTLLRALRPDGTRVWQLDVHGSVSAIALARDGTLFVATQGDGRDAGRVLAIASTGELQWSYYAESPNALVLGDGVLYVAAGRRVYALGQCPREACEDDGTALAALGEPARAAPRSIASSEQPAKPAPTRAEPHGAYTVYPDCRAATTAIVSRTGDPFPWVERWSPTAKAEAEREEFRSEAVAAAGAITSHASGFGVACVERAAFIIMVTPGQDVAAAALRIGEWLVKTGQRGEIDILVTPVPHEL